MPPESVTPPAPTSDDRISKLLDEIEKFKEIIETRAIGFNIRLATLEESIVEMTKAIVGKSAEAPKSTAADSAVEDTSADDSTGSIVLGLKDALAFYKSGAGEGK